MIFAVSLGGDCHCVPMAASLSAALHGLRSIPSDWRNFCEGIRETELLAAELVASRKIQRILVEDPAQTVE